MKSFQDDKATHQGLHYSTMLPCTLREDCCGRATRFVKYRQQSCHFCTFLQIAHELAAIADGGKA
jgi:hypothetical protein